MIFVGGFPVQAVHIIFIKSTFFYQLFLQQKIDGTAEGAGVCTGSHIKNIQQGTPPQPALHSLPSLCVEFFEYFSLDMTDPDR